MNVPPPSKPVPECEQRAEQLNHECRGTTLDRQELSLELSRQAEGADLPGMILDQRPHLFSDSTVFLDEHRFLMQAETIAAIEKVVALPAYHEQVLAHAPATARFAPKAPAVFLGYDFHLSPGGAQLIEINTNAGGGLLGVLLAHAQHMPVGWKAGEDSPQPSLWQQQQDAEQAFLDMFLDAWRAERGDAPLRLIAIVDDVPEGQFLFPEFLLFQRLFEHHGIEAVICDPAGLALREGGLWHGGHRIDLVYNRLTDFGLDLPAHQSLREAYLDSAVVVTPHPRAHALYADKRNLAVLTDAAALAGMGVDGETINRLQQGIAHTDIVRKEDADGLWARRKRLFFKPAAGYGSKATYRGDKLTRRVFDEILHGDYVAQALVPPSERLLEVDGQTVALKLDLRHFVYRSAIQLTVARLYQGQTTNFRTPGGGFAPVVLLPCVETP